jgi:hypothetical protein
MAGNFAELKVHIRYYAELRVYIVIITIHSRILVI